MSFKNLEDRYNQTVNTLYAGAKSKFDNGKPSRGANDDPLIVRRPGEGYFGGASRILGRFLPASSAAQDVKRLTLFTVSTRGISFLLRQQVLQTGNTFEQTRLLNPTFVVGNAVPFLRIRRNLRGGPLLGKTDTSYQNVRKLGQLQTETYNALINNNSPVKFLKKIPVVGQTISAVRAKRNVGEGDEGNDTWNTSRPELGPTVKDYIIPKLFTPPPNQSSPQKTSGIFNRLKQLIIANNTNIGLGGFKYGGKVYTDQFKSQKYGAIGKDWDGTYIKYLNNKPDVATSEYNTFIYKQTGQSLSGWILTRTKSKKDQLSLTAQTTTLTTSSFIDSQLRTEQTNKYNSEKNIPYIQYFEGGQNSIRGIPQLENGFIRSQNARDLSLESNGTRKRISYLRDPLNSPARGNSRPERVLRLYNDLPTNKKENGPDIIQVAIAMGNDDPIQFRAFIKDINQTATPEYKSYQYIGRIEKFVSYVGVQREVSFKLGVIAFSKDELTQVWKRINYLTGTVYPYNVYKGILQPNIIRLTIGDIYRDQPGYIAGLTTNFSELSESWEIDKDRQVPISAQMDMKFVLIEKMTKTAGSPLYSITEKNFLGNVLSGTT